MQPVLVGNHRRAQLTDAARGRVHGGCGDTGRIGRARPSRRARHADPRRRIAFVLHDLPAVPVSLPAGPCGWIARRLPRRCPAARPSGGVNVQAWRCRERRSCCPWQPASATWLGPGPAFSASRAWRLTARQTWLTWLPALPGPPCRPSARPAMQLSRQVDDRVWAGPDAGKRALPSWYSPARSAGRPGTLSWNSAERSGSVTGHSAIARQRAETGRLVGPCRTSPSR